MTLDFSIRQICRIKNINTTSLDVFTNRLSLYELIQNNILSSLTDISEIISSDTLAPAHVPEEFHSLSVWRKLELFEDKYAKQRFPNNALYYEDCKNSAQVAMEISFSFPNEISAERKKELIADFAKEHFVSQGFIVTYAIFKEELKPQAQMVISRRSVNEDGDFSWTKNRDMCSKKYFIWVKKAWIDYTNT